MSFKDSDLEELKKLAVGYDQRMVTPLANMYPKINALIARLEAAEKVCFYADGINGLESDVKAWLKSKGEAV